MPYEDKLDDCQEFKACTVQEQAFIRAYVYGEKPGQGIEAAIVAYNVSNRDSASSIAGKKLKDKRVQAAIAFAKGNDYITDSAFWTRLKWALEQDQSASVAMRALELIAEIKGFVGKQQKMAKVEQQADVVDELAERLNSMPLGTVLKATQPHDTDPTST